MAEDFQPTDFDYVPLEQMRNVIAALAAHLGLRLESRQQFYDETEFRFVSKQIGEPPCS